MNTQQDKTIGRMARGFGAAAACAALLAGCGGGGGGSGDTTVTPPVLVNLSAVAPGFWAGTLTNGPEASTRASAVVMPDLTTWVAYETGVGVVGVSKLGPMSGTATSETTASITDNGNYFSLANSGAATAQAVTGTITSTGAGSGTIAATSTVGSTTTTASLTAQAGFTTAAALSSIASSTFVGNLGGGSVQVTWKFDATGNLVAGPANSFSSTGCTYTGSVTPVASIAVFNVNVTETCQTTARVLSGIATFKAAAGATPASLRAIFTANTTPTTGGLLSLDKQ